MMNRPMHTPAANEDPRIGEIFDALLRGEGREEVNASNVGALQDLAERNQHPVLAEELREWKQC